MPSRPGSQCSTPGCPNLGTNGGRCEPCQTKTRGSYEQDRGSASARGYDRNWQRLRLIILHRDPICKACGQAASEDVDHIVPKAQGGTDDEANLQGLCASCHSRKTATEDGGFGRPRGESNPSALSSVDRPPSHTRAGAKVQDPHIAGPGASPGLGIGAIS